MIGVVLMVSAVLIGGVWLLHVWKDIPVGKLLRDPLVVAGAPPYYGIISQVGIFLWSAAAAICLFSAKALSSLCADMELRRFLFVSGILTLFLGLDDAFLLHDDVLPRIGIRERIVYLGYALTVSYYLIRFRWTILKSEYILLGMALFSFALSIAVDRFQFEDTAGRLLEDGAKLVGIVSWLAYFSCTGLSALRRKPTHADKSAPTT